MVNHRNDDFEQRVIASTYPFDQTLTLASQLLGKPEEEPVDRSGIFYPTTGEEFDQMISLWEAGDA